MSRPFCVCVPARNEADRIGTLIDALASQTVDEAVPLLLCVNNSLDDTVAAAKAAAARTSDKIDLQIFERWFDEPLAHAGSARRAVMEFGADYIDADAGVLISTDADCRPPAEWISNILAVIEESVIVGGKIELDDIEQVPAGILAIRMQFDAYWRQVRSIEDSLDPRPWDPTPRHGDHTGASLALSKGLYRRAGGVPLLATGEDRALVEAAVGMGGTLIHPVSVWTRVSARTKGRATGGMASEMRRWIEASENHALSVPSFAHWRERALWRAALRQFVTPSELLKAEAALPAMACDMLLAALDYEPA